MVDERKCPLFRKPENLGMGIGYCDVDSGSATCEGEVGFCEKPDALKKYIRSKSEEIEKKEK